MLNEGKRLKTVKRKIEENRVNQLLSRMARGEDPLQAWEKMNKSGETGKESEERFVRSILKLEGVKRVIEVSDGDDFFRRVDKRVVTEDPLLGGVWEVQIKSTRTGVDDFVEIKRREFGLRSTEYAKIKMARRGLLVINAGITYKDPERNEGYIQYQFMEQLELVKMARKRN